MTGTPVALGIDIGTTGIKAAAYDLHGQVAVEDRIDTPWDVSSNGETEIDADVLADACIGLLDSVADACAKTGDLVGVGITGMAETGVIVDAAGRPRHRGIAWFDERGARQLGELPSDVAESFTGITGLARKAECSLSKLLWLRDQGLMIGADDVWLNVQEYVAYRLTGNRFTERSLASRTALVDQDSAGPWLQALDLIGATESFLPPFQPPGRPFGQVVASGSSRFRGLPVTVAGHDHLVAAIGSGATGPNQLFNSCGTADVLVRSIPWKLDSQARTGLVAGGLSAGMHVLPGRTAILGATRFGLVLERVLTAVGATTVDERERLTSGWDSTRPRNQSVIVSEPPDWTNEVTVSLKGATSQREVVDAAIDYGVLSTQPLIGLMSGIVGTFDDAMAGGGWVQLTGVRRAKEALLPRLELSPIPQPGIRGAAALAAISAGCDDYPLTRELAKQFESTMQREITL